ncbi:hypothetical protein ACFX5U_09595 [Sphingobacterium sp. SG20118]|uniref:hypothetical protein n=1 Tax=Sphingobacterium sp. SG20118 TaxID=3367156 RepID=UPI0037DFC738
MENEFFLPFHTGTVEDSEKVYASIKKFVSDQVGDIWSSRIFSISFTHEGKFNTCTVGEKTNVVDDTVICILRNETLFFVCTPQRGVIRGMPILVGSHEVSNIEYFKNSLHK